MLKIKIDELNSNLYTLKETQSKNINLYLVSPTSYSPTSYSPYCSMGILTEPEVKHIKLDKLVFYVDKNSNCVNNNCASFYNINTIETIYNIKNELGKEYIKIVSELGKLNREIFGDYFDINNANITEDEIIFKLREARFRLSSNNYNIWLLSNVQTFNHIFDKIPKKWNTKCQVVIDDMNCFIDNMVEDGMIIMGQKSEHNVVCHILTDANGNIVFEQREIGYNVELTMYFAFINNNLSQEAKYFLISTRDIRYYRNKKIQKIKIIRELYGKN